MTGACGSTTDLLTQSSRTKIPQKGTTTKEEFFFAISTTIFHHCLYIFHFLTGSVLFLNLQIKISNTRGERR